MAKFSIKPFTSNELATLESFLSPKLLDWAIKNPSVREPGKDHRLIRDLAAIHALGKALLAKGRLDDFRDAVSKGYDMNVMHRDLQHYSPKERAGTAAGQLSVAKLLVEWYGLKREDFTRLRAPRNAIEFAYSEEKGLKEAVCTTPQTLGITKFTARDVYLTTRAEAESAVAARGASALDPYMVFPEYPITK